MSDHREILSETRSWIQICDIIPEAERRLPLKPYNTVYTNATGGKLGVGFRIQECNKRADNTIYLFITYKVKRYHIGYGICNNSVNNPIIGIMFCRHLTHLILLAIVKCGKQYLASAGQNIVIN